MVRLNYWKRVLLIIIVGVIGCAGVLQAKPKNVIFLIGDGMGPEQVKAAGIYAYGAPGTLSFESFPYQGELTTYQYGGGIPDSAAAGTSLATGFKVNGGVISMAYPAYPPVYLEGSELPTLLEYFKALGKSTGLVSASYLTDATPAAFGAHEPTRSNTSQIAGDYLNQNQPNVLFGGGANGLTPETALAAGYVVVGSRDEMLALNTETVTRVSGQFGSGQMPYEYNGLGSLPHLSEMTATALSILDNDTDGLFLMVEGGNIDHACHSSDLARTIPEVSEFADAVQVAVNWAAGRNDTLILVAADHETGGLTVTANNGAGVLPGVTWATTGHTAANVPVYAWGVNAELISGVMDNTDTFGVVVSDEPIELVSPAYDAVGVSTSPSLEVIVRDPDGSDPLDVTFFGRENPSFTIVVLPDTQKYVLNGAYPQIFTSQTQWIVDNAVSENIVFMTHEGDIVETWNSTTEWGYANDSISLLDGVVPYGLAVGNHDKYENPADPMYDTVSTYFNQTFPYTRYESEPWYGGHYPAAPDPNGNSNNYQIFSAGGADYIVLHLEDYPTYETVAWADGVLKANPARKAIITTHGYMDTGGNYTGKWGSTQYIRDLVVANDNVYFVLCGHFTGEYTKTTTVNGRLVHEMMADYQGRANGGDGWLRILRFEPDEDKVYVKTYSTWHDAYEVDSGSQFTLDFPMSGYAFSAIGTNSGVPSGANTSLTWPGRKMETHYEWYVTVTDDTVGTTPGPVWSFTTGSPKAGNPSPADGAADVDTNADLSWSAGVDAVSHDVYFGTDAGNLLLVSDRQAGTTYDPGLLQLDTMYYWAIDEHNSVGGVTYGDVWSFTTAPPAPLTFQQGVNGYTGMVDTMIRSPAPTTNYADSAVNYDSGYQYQYNADTSTGSPAGPSHVLLRFDDIVGSSPGQIPAGSTILSATLRLRTMDDSNGGKLHRLLQSWVATTVTWANAFGGNGIQADGSEAAVTEDDGVASTSGAGDSDLNVTATVQGYVDGTITNNGWTLLPNGSNGWHIAAAEHPTADYRPELIVTFSSAAPQPAGNPNPADGATQAAVDADLSWTAGTGAVSHDVYFGTAQPPVFVQNQMGTTYDPGLLLPNTTYYWQIDERDSVGGVVTGAVWSFTTAAAPTQAGTPGPVNGAAGVSIDADLTWTAGSGTTSHKVYFGTDPDPRVNTPVNQTESTYDPGILNAATAYYWAVDEVGPGGTTAGEVWSFTTAAPDTQPPVTTGATGNTSGTTGEPVTISATIIDNVAVTSATVHYTPIDGSEGTAPMTQGGGNIWSGGVPVASNKVGTITYYITGQDAVPNTARDPSSGTYSITVTDNDAPSKVIDLTATAIGGGGIELTWSAATDNVSVVIYNVYRHIAAITAPDPAKRIATGVTGTSYPDTPGADGTYYYAVTGIDSAGNEAQVSNSPSATIDTTPPAISAVTSTSITDSSATITWTTNEASSSVVKYGTTTPTTEVSDAAMVTSHSVTITGLSAATTYYYQVKSIDAAGNTTTDNNGGTYYTFTTSQAFPQTLFSDGFESGNFTAGGWTTSGSATVSSAAAYNGSYGANLKKAASIHKALSTTGYKQIHIKFARKTTGMDAGEYLYAEWSTDGSVWNTLETTQDTVWASRDLLCPAGADNNAGFRLRFRTNANLTAEYACVDVVEIIGTPLGPVNNPPSVTIILPANGSTIASGASIPFEGTATDVEDGDLTGSLVWQSNIDGQIGTGGNFSAILSNGDHIITASVTDSGAETDSASVNITVGDAPPGAPTGLAATAGNGQVTLDWADNTESDLSGYNVYRSTTQGSGYAKINSTLVLTSNYVDSTVINGTTYYYVVTAVDTGSNESVSSNEVSATPSSASAVFVTSIVKRPFVPAGKSVKAVTGVTISAPQTGGTVSGNWYFKGALVQTGATGTTNAGGYTEIASAPAKASTGDVFRFVVTNVVLSGYTYDPGQNIVSEISITYP